MGEMEEIIHNSGYGEMNLWMCLTVMAKELDKLNRPTYGPMLEESEGS